MANPTTSPEAIVLDANAVIAFCTKEAGRYEKIKAYFEYHTSGGSLFYAPGVMIAESLYVFCRKLTESKITQSDHSIAVRALELLVENILPPLDGESTLIAPAERIRASLGCSHSADGLYIALAEQMTKSGTAEIVTFDQGLQKQASANAPLVKVTVLT
jgi:predicted nucleic acid-binding protein